MTPGVPPSPQTLVDLLTASGELTDMAWRNAFLAVPRDVFVPGHDPLYAYSDEALVTQTRLAHHPGGGSVDLPTSSASAPSVVAAMLDLLAVHDGIRVLEIGTGTGYNTALLAHRLGADQVHSLDVDPDLIASANTVLHELGYRVHPVAADGNDGLPGAAPFDRIIATCAITHVPPAWIRQLAPGGRIVAPLHADGAPLAVLDKTADDEVTGRLDACRADFMPLRPHLDNPLATGRRLGFPTLGRVGHHGITDLDPRAVADTDTDWRWFLALHIPGLTVGTARDREHRDWITLTSPDGYAEATVGGHGRWNVVQHGRRLWDTAEHAHRDWTALQAPDRSRYGITAAADQQRQYVWLDDPDGPYAWPLQL
jgi:protein-L-isoaspartate(D-aspartate) O-methyltransferase